MSDASGDYFDHIGDALPNAEAAAGAQGFAEHLGGSGGAGTFGAPNYDALTASIQQATAAIASAHEYVAHQQQQAVTFIMENGADVVDGHSPVNAPDGVGNPVQSDSPTYEGGQGGEQATTYVGDKGPPNLPVVDL